MASLNRNTPASRVWKRLNKVPGKYPSHASICLSYGGNEEMDQQRVAEIMAEHYAAISSNDSYNPAFVNTNERQESVAINFATNDHLKYNASLTVK